MNLTPEQKDSLTELINIGYGRAAGALSELTGHRVTLEVPQVAIHDIAEVSPLLEQVIPGEVASVNQVFNGPIAGNALLLLDEKAALILSQLLTEERAAGGKLDAAAREIITEVGNILLNACLGVFGNLLKVHVSFTVPSLRIENIQHLLHSLDLEAEGKLRFALMIHTRFQLRSSQVTGYMVIVLGIISLDRLLKELENWEKRQIP
jgi:chemotaxis protein CheC